MIKRLLILLILLIAVPCYGATIYIDPTASGNNDGTTPTHAFESWTGVTGGAGFVRNNTYVQKCGTTYPGTLSIATAASGTDKIIISAYNADGTSEIGKEVFGANCSGGLAKPIIDDDDTGGAVSIGADYIELNSIHVKDGDSSIYVNGGNNIIKYCEVSGGRGGIRSGLSSSTNVLYIGYNYLHTDWGHDEILDDLDGIQIAGYTDNATIEYNVIDGYAHSAVGVSNTNSSGIEVRYNSMYSWDDAMDQCMTANGTNSTFHHNYCTDCGVIQMYNASGNSVYSNVIDGISTNSYIQGGSQIALQPLLAGDNVIDNKIYNNTIYDRRDSGWNPVCITLYGWSAVAGVIERNEIYNNICLNFDSTSVVFYVLDPNDKVESNPADPDVNIWRNNLAYGWTAANVAYIEGDYYVDITDKGSTYFNNYGAAYNNLDSDPGLEDPANSEFWPSSSASAVYQAGYNVGAPYDTLLLSTSDFTASPPLVNTDQFANDYIGAYGLVGATKSYPFQGAAGNFKLN